MAEILAPDDWPTTRPVGSRRPLAAALGLSISLHLALLAGLRLHLPIAAHPLLRPAPLTAYLAPPVPQHAAAAHQLPGAVATARPKKTAANHRIRPAAAVRPPSLHPAPLRHRAPPQRPAPMPREQPPTEALARPEADKVRTPLRPVRTHPPILRHHPQVADSPVPRPVVRSTLRQSPPHPETALAEAPRTRTRPVRPHAPVVTRQSSNYAAPTVAGAPDRALPSARQAGPYRHARRPGRVTSGGGVAAPAAAPSAEAMVPGSDIRVLGRSRVMAPPVGPAAEGAANDAGNSAAGETNRPLALLTPVHPDYPLAARRDNIEGAVVVRIWVDAAGNVSNVQVLRATPPGYFESAAIAAVRQWHYAPALRHGHPVAAVVAGYTLRFRLLDADE